MLSDEKTLNLWELTAPPAPETSRLSGDTSADVVVIGAGYTGLSAALHLAEAGHEVVVLEAREIGHGGSGRNVGLVNAGMWIQPETLVATLGGEAGPRLIETLGQGPSEVFDLIARFGIDCEAERQGTLHLAASRAGLADLAARARQWQSLGAPVRLLDAAETRELTGAQGYFGALHDARAGTVQPLAYARGLARAALTMGARVHTQSPASSATREGNRWRIETPDGSATAPHVIVATNAYTGLDGNAPWHQVRTELTHLPFFQVATAPLRQDLGASILPQRHGCWDTAKILTSLRMDRHRRLVFGSVGALEGASATVHRDYAKRSLRRLFPQLEDIDFEAEWHGAIGMTSDHLPRFHMLADGVISISGYNGRGIAPGTVFGRELAQYILAGTPPSLPDSPVVPARFTTLRGMALKAGAALAHFAGGRWPR